MRKSKWCAESVERLRSRDPKAWSVFQEEIMPMIRRCLRRMVTDEDDLDDLCMISLHRILDGLSYYDESKGQSLRSFAWMKANSVGIRFIQGNSHQQPETSLENLRDEGFDCIDESPNASDAIEGGERARAITKALIELEPEEQRFLVLREEGYSLAECAAGAGYPPSDNPAYVIKRIKRKLERLLKAVPHFMEHPEELVPLNVPIRKERD